MSNPDSSKRTYLYKQLSDKLRKEIHSGKYKTDERLPSMDDLSKAYAMNRITVKRALSELRAEGLIYSIPAQGTYVSAGDASPVPPGNKHKTIGLILSGLETHAFGSYHVDVITGIQEALGKLEWYLMLIVLDDPSEDRAYEHVMQVQLDGTIYLGIFQPSLLRRLVRNGPPSVLIDQKLRGLKCDVINVDNYTGAYEATEHLIDLGHRQLACVTGHEGHVSQERKEGVQDAWTEAKLDSSKIQWIEGNFQKNSGNAAAEKILKSKKKPTAIFCFNDEMAAGVMQTLHASNSVEIPKDISVMGFDNTNWTIATFPQMTSVQVERFSMGNLAVQRLQAHFEADTHTPTLTSVSTSLVVRESTTKPPKA